MANVVMYTKRVCPYCVKAKGLLNSKGVAVKEISIEGNDVLREEMIRLSGGAMTVPQIFIDGYHVGGCDDLYALEEGKELNKLLGI